MHNVSLTLGVWMHSMCALMERRIYTTPKVTDVKHYLYKVQVFDGNGYDDEHRRPWGDFMPGFDLLFI